MDGKSTTTYNYDFYGKLNYKLDAKGQKLEYTYDTNNRVTKSTTDPRQPKMRGVGG